MILRHGIVTLAENGRRWQHAATGLMAIIGILLISGRAG